MDNLNAQQVAALLLIAKQSIDIGENAANLPQIVQTFYDTAQHASQLIVAAGTDVEIAQAVQEFKTSNPCLHVS